MISWDNIVKYREQFNTNRCAYLEPDTLARVGVETEDGNTYIQPINETDDVFVNRLERSKIANENLFFKEWEKLEYDPNVLY